MYMWIISSLSMIYETCSWTGLDLTNIVVCRVVYLQLGWGVLNQLPPCRYHDDVIEWKHYPRYWPFVRRIQQSPVDSLHKGYWRALMFSLTCAWANGWTNTRDSVDLRHHRAHYQWSHCNVSRFCQHWLSNQYHIYIWLVTPQLSCGDTCQIWKWLKIITGIAKLKGKLIGEMNDRSFCNRIPVPFLIKLSMRYICLVLSLSKLNRS